MCKQKQMRKVPQSADLRTFAGHKTSAPTTFECRTPEVLFVGGKCGVDRLDEFLCLCLSAGREIACILHLIETTQ